MKLIESSVEYLLQEDGVDGIYKQIERCARTCYKSEDKITENSAKNFVDKMIKSHHTAMLEHGTVYINFPMICVNSKQADKIIKNKDITLHQKHSPYEPHVYFGLLMYLNCKNSPYARAKLVRKDNIRIDVNIATNLRFFGIDDYLLGHVCTPTEYHERRYTFKFVCSRAIANELVRHRVFSFAQESQRYCNYSKEKHGGEITFIKPSWFKENQLSLDLKAAQSSETNGAVFYERPYKAYWIDTDAEGFDWYKEDFFIHSCQTSEQCYLLMLEEGAVPQQARDVLPNATKTELIMTGFASDWRYLLDLRLFEKTGKVHPDMLDLMQKLQKVMQESGIWEDIMNYPSIFKEDERN